MADKAIVRHERPKRWATAQADAVLRQMDATDGTIAPYVERTGSIFGHLGTAAVVSLTLGAMDAAVGPEPGGVPVDGLLGVAALATSVLTAGSAVSDYAMTNGVMLSGMFLRRKTAELMKAEAPTTTSQAPSTPKEDPIVAFDKSRKT